MNMTMKSMRCLLALLLLTSAVHAAEASVFPPKGSEKRVRGQLLSADFIHRTGTFRAEDGTLTPFRLIPAGIMRYRGSEADMREVPLGTQLTFLLLPDAEGKLTRLISTEDDQPADPAQHQRFIDFTKARGVAAIIDKTEGRLVTLTFFSGDPAAFQKDFMPDFAKGKTVKLCVSNDELRTWNPGVDGDASTVEEVRELPADGVFGSSGVQVVLKTSNMLEGFRRGRVVRVFGAGWKVQDQLYGESLMGYGFGRMLNPELVENVAKEYPEQFPFRTDHGNPHLPWFQLKPGTKPPPFSEHVVHAELVKADRAKQAGQFRIEGTGKLVDFTLIEKPTLKRLGNDAWFEHLAIGQRHRFHTYQDEKGEFTRVSFITDEFSHQSAIHTTARIIAVDVKDNRLDIAWQLPEVKDYNGDMQRPKDIAQTRLHIDADTRLWKGDTQAQPADLTVGTTILFNLGGTPTRCSDIWIGEDTHKLVIESGKKAPKTAKK